MIKYFEGLEGLEKVSEITLYAVVGLFILLVLLLILSPTTTINIVLQQDDRSNTDTEAIREWKQKWNGRHFFRQVNVQFPEPKDDTCSRFAGEDKEYPITDCTLEQYIARASNRLERLSDSIDIAEVDAPWINTIGDHLATLNECASESDSSGFISGMIWRIRELWSTFTGSESDEFNSSEACADVGELTKHLPRIVEQGKVRGELKGIPLFTTIGLLFYNSDLLACEGQQPPKTWQQLEEISRSFVKRHNKAVNSDLPACEGKEPSETARLIDKLFDNEDLGKEWIGFAWQGGQYEGLMCNLSEWMDEPWAPGSNGPHQGSEGPGCLKTADLARTLLRTLLMVKSWISKDADNVGISPKAVLEWKEVEARNEYKKGRTLFMRAWPRTYADVKNAVHTSIAPMPGSEVRQHGTTGPWYLAIPQRSKNKDIAMDLIEHLTSERNQLKRATEKYLLPTRRELYDRLEGDKRDPSKPAAEGLKEIDDFLRPNNGRLVDLVKGEGIERPFEVLGSCYPEFAFYVEKTVNGLLKKSDELSVTELDTKFKEIDEKICACQKRMATMSLRSMPE